MAVINSDKEELKDPAFDIRKKIRAIAEIRYPAIPHILDIRGKLIETLRPEIQDSLKHWKVSHEEVVFNDDLNKPTTEFLISLKRAAVLYEDFQYMKEFVTQTKRYFRLFYNELGGSVKNLSRIGVRILEVCTTKDLNTHERAINLISTSFMTLPEDLKNNITDSHIKIIHKYGQFTVGPFKNGEPWLNEYFVHPETNVPEFGIGLDIDSYATDISNNSTEELLKSFDSVYNLTKSTEETLLKHAGLIDA